MSREIRRISALLILLIFIAGTVSAATWSKDYYWSPWSLSNWGGEAGLDNGDLVLGSQQRVGRAPNPEKDIWSSNAVEVTDIGVASSLYWIGTNGNDNDDEPGLILLHKGNFTTKKKWKDIHDGVHDLEKGPSGYIYHTYGGNDIFKYSSSGDRLGRINGGDWLYGLEVDGSNVYAWQRYYSGSWKAKLRVSGKSTGSSLSNTGIKTDSSGWSQLGVGSGSSDYIAVVNESGADIDIYNKSYDAVDSISETSCSTYRDLDVGGSYIYVGCDSGKIYIYDKSDIGGSLKSVQNITTNGNLKDIELQGGGNFTYSTKNDAGDGQKAVFVTTSPPTNQTPRKPDEAVPRDGEIVSTTKASVDQKLQVEASDPDGDSMQVCFYNASDNSQIGCESSTGTEAEASVTWSGLPAGNTYNWYAVADDGASSQQSTTWSFSVDSNNAPETPTNPSPADGSLDVSTRPELKINVSDPEGDQMNVSFHDADTGNVIGWHNNTANGTSATEVWEQLENSSNYTWYAKAYDRHGASTATGVFSFNTTASAIIDDFEDGDIKEWEGQTEYYSSNTNSPVYHGSYSLKGPSGASQTISSLSGLPNYPEVGDRIKLYSYVQDSQYTQARFLFGYKNSSNYYELDINPENSRLRLLRKKGGSTTTLASDTSFSPKVQWLETEINWDSDGTINLTVWNETGTQLSQLSTTDTSFTSGGIGWKGKSATSNALIPDYLRILTGNNPPGAPSNPSPADGSEEVSTSLNLTVNVSDNDGDFLDVKFYNASSDSLIGTDKQVATGSKAEVQWKNLQKGTTYKWYAVADDDTASTQSSTWNFTTQSNPAPQITAKSPNNTNVNPGGGVELTVKAGDPNGDQMNITFYNASSGNSIGNVKNVDNGTYSVQWTGLPEDSTFDWYAEVNDGVTVTTSSTPQFTTISIRLSWNDQSSGEEGFRIYTNSTGSFHKTGSIGADKTSFKDFNFGLDFGEYTCYRVKSYNSFGESSPATGCITP
ncbi:MAG: hypothetical protein ABEJ98_04025 [Candidatus Nanohaloarchaea archaeon]